MTPEEIVIALLETLAEKVGLPLIIKWLTSKVPQDQATALLEAEYAAARAAADAEAKAVLGG